MTIVDKTARGQTDAITFEVELRHSPKKVWRALTDPVLLQEWLLPVLDFKLEKGAAFGFKTDPQPGWDGSVNCELIDFEEQKTISYTWRVGTFLDTVVSFTLTPTESGTCLTIVQSGFKPEQKQNFGGARYGWRLMGGRLIDVLEKVA